MTRPSDEALVQEEQRGQIQKELKYEDIVNVINRGFIREFFNQDTLFSGSNTGSNPGSNLSVHIPFAHLFLPWLCWPVDW